MNWFKKKKKSILEEIFEEYGIEIWYEEHMNRLYWIRKKNEHGSLPGIFNVMNNKTMIVDAIMSKLDTNWLLKHKRNNKLERLEI